MDEIQSATTNQITFLSKLHIIGPPLQWTTLNISLFPGIEKLKSTQISFANQCVHHKHEKYAITLEELFYPSIQMSQ